MLLGEHEILLAVDELLSACMYEVLGAASAVLAFNLNLAGFISRCKLLAI